VSPLTGHKKGGYVKSDDVVAQLIDFDEVGPKCFGMFIYPWQ
jgi:hypothetical protein